VIARTPRAPTIVVVEIGAAKGEAAAEMTATESVAPTEAVTTAPVTATAVTATAADQDERAACCTQWLPAEIARLCERRSAGKRKRKSAEKTGSD
jgi:hypothetical protein